MRTTRTDSAKPNAITNGARVYDRGDFSNDPKFGTVIAVDQKYECFTVEYDDGRKLHAQPFVLLAEPAPRFKIVA